MNEFKGTKGKWNYIGNEIIFDENGYAVIPCGNVNIDEKEYNFNLASKAPDMLEILNNLVNNRTEILNGLNESKGKYDYEWLFNSAEKLIKEATELK